MGIVSNYVESNGKLPLGIFPRRVHTHLARVEVDTEGDEDRLNLNWDFGLEEDSQEYTGQRRGGGVLLSLFLWERLELWWWLMSRRTNVQPLFCFLLVSLRCQLDEDQDDW